MSTELALIEIKNPLVVFSTPKGLDAIIDKIEAEVKSVDRDISTEEGRANIRSIAFKLAKSKTALDKIGLDLTEDQRKQIQAVNAERKRAWERMEALQHEIRKPLTDWEDAEKTRVADHEAALAHIESLGVFAEAPTTAQIEERIRQFSVLAPRKWQEFEPRYLYTVKTLSDGLETKLAASQKRDAEAAELERLRAEESARKQKEHEDRIAKEAEEKARTEAEAKAKAEATALAAKVEQERLKIESEKQAAIEAAAKAESDRLAAIAKAESDRIAAETKAEMERLAAIGREKVAKFQAEKDAEAAAQRERDKIAAEKKAEADALAKREADLHHRKKINNEALAAISALTGEDVSEKESAARKIVEAIAQGKIPHVKIIY